MLTWKDKFKQDVCPYVWPCEIKMKNIIYKEETFSIKGFESEQISNQTEQTYEFEI